MKKKLLSIMACIAFVLNACATDPNLTRRYYTHEYQPLVSFPDKAVDFSVFTLEVEPASKPKTVFDLGEEAQAELIRALAESIKENKNSKDPAKDLFTALASPIEGEKKTPDIEYRNLFDRQVVFSFENKSPDVGDRIRWLRVTLRLNNPTGNGEEKQIAWFKSWNKFTSEYKDVDLGSLAFIQGSKLNLELGATIPAGPVGLSPKVSGEFTRNLAEEVELSQRYEEFSGRLQKYYATFVREGVVGIDLTGEAIVEMTIQVDYKPVPYTSMKGLMLNNTPNQQAKVKVLKNEVRVPLEARPIYVIAELEYILRHANTGKNTVIEGDDHVTDYYGKVPPLNVELISKEDLAHYAWRIVVPDEKTERSLHLDWRITQEDEPQPKVIWFDSYDEAEDFVIWLKKTMSARVGGKEICKFIATSCNTITYDDISNLEIEFEPVNLRED